MLHCNFCTNVTSSLQQHLEHYKLHETTSCQFVCGFLDCRRAYKKRNSLLVHYLKIHQLSVMNDVRKMLDRSNPSGRYTCSDINCRTEFTSLYNLTKHMKKHLRDGSIILCPFDDCKFTYQKVNSFSSHISRYHYRAMQVTNNVETGPSLRRENMEDNYLAESTGNILVKITTSENLGSYKMILVSTLSDVIEKGIKKLKLPETEYKVFTDDRSEIDEEIIFQQVVAQTKDLKIILVAGDQDINFSNRSGILKGNSNQNNNTTSLPVLQNNVQNNDTTTLENDKQYNLDVADILSKIPESYVRIEPPRKYASAEQYRILSSWVANYVMTKIKHCPLKLSKNIAKKICDSHHQFRSEVGGKELEGTCAHIVLAKAIYDKCFYRKPDASLSRKRKRLLNAINTETSLKKFKRDSYGCVEGKYNPELKSTDDIDLLEEKRLDLVKYHGESIECVEVIVRTLMDDTYEFQRRDIMSNSLRCYTQLFSRWPYLEMPLALYQHANILLGRENIQDEWKKSLDKWADDTRKFLEISEYNKLTSSKNGTKIKYFSKTLAVEAENASRKMSGSRIPLISVIFPQIVNYFKEEPEYLYKIVDVDSEHDQILKDLESFTPTLVVKGTSLFDKDSFVFVAIEKVRLLKVPNILDGFLLTLLLYYIFDFNYPQEICYSLEFIQRLFLGINAYGCKPVNGKKNINDLSRKVISLIKDIEEYRDCSGSRLNNDNQQAAV